MASLTKNSWRKHESSRANETRQEFTEYLVGERKQQKYKNKSEKWPILVVTNIFTRRKILPD